MELRAHFVIRMISPIEECATFQNLQIWISFSFFLTPFTASDFNRVFCIVWKIHVVSWVVVFCQPPCEMASVLPLALHLDFYWRLSLKRNTVANLEDSIKIRYACMHESSCPCLHVGLSGPSMHLWCSLHFEWLWFDPIHSTLSYVLKVHFDNRFLYRSYDYR